MTGNASAVRRLQEPKTTQKMGQVKEQGGGGEEKKKTLADKLPTWPVMPECAHRHLMLSLAVIPCILTNKMFDIP